MTSRDELRTELSEAERMAEQAGSPADKAGWRSLAERLRRLLRPAGGGEKDESER